VPGAPPSPPPDEAELQRLGLALGEHAGEVLERVSVRANGDGRQLAAPTRSSFARMCMLATTTLALWMAGEASERGLHAGREAWELFGDLAANREAPIDEVIRRCLLWRDCVAEVLREQAEPLHTPADVLARAIAMTQTTLDGTLVRVGATFEAGDARSADELTRRWDTIAFTATHDRVTGLPARGIVLDRAAQMLARARRKGTASAALVIHVDNLTTIRDRLGRAEGDELLRAISVRLDGVVRESDVLGHLEGDSFVLLAEAVPMTATATAQMIAERLRDALREPFALPGHEAETVSMTATIGIASGTYVNGEELIRDAVNAMRRARTAGGAAIGC
jgi:diguanylate cyclase (GGDEF)-like protein